MSRRVVGTERCSRGCSGFPPPICAGGDFCKAWTGRELKTDPSKLLLVPLISECTEGQEEAAG